MARPRAGSARRRDLGPRRSTGELRPGVVPAGLRAVAAGLHRMPLAGVRAALVDEEVLAVVGCARADAGTLVALQRAPLVDRPRADDTCEVHVVDPLDPGRVEPGTLAHRAGPRLEQSGIRLTTQERDERGAHRSRVGDLG